MSAFDAATSIPDKTTSGEYVVWSETLADYPQGTYTVAYNFVDLATPVDGYEKFSVAGSGSGTTWTFTMPTGGSAPKPGRYRWQQVVTRVSDSKAVTIASGVLIIAPDFSATPTTTAAQTMLAALETAITSLSSGLNETVSFNGQSFTKKNLRQLYDMRRDLQAEILLEQRRLAELSGEIPTDGTIGVRFR